MAYFTAKQVFDNRWFGIFFDVSHQGVTVQWLHAVPGGYAGSNPDGTDILLRPEEKLNVLRLVSPDSFVQNVEKLICIRALYEMQKQKKIPRNWNVCSYEQNKNGSYRYIRWIEYYPNNVGDSKYSLHTSRKADMKSWITTVPGYFTYTVEIKGEK